MPPGTIVPSGYAAVCKMSSEELCGSPSGGQGEEAPVLLILVRSEQRPEALRQVRRHFCWLLAFLLSLLLLHWIWLETFLGRLTFSPLRRETLRHSPRRCWTAPQRWTSSSQGRDGRTSRDRDSSLCFQYCGALCPILHSAARPLRPLLQARGLALIHNVSCRPTWGKRAAERGRHVSVALQGRKDRRRGRGKRGTAVCEGG